MSTNDERSMPRDGLNPEGETISFADYEICDALRINRREARFLRGVAQSRGKAEALTAWLHFSRGDRGFLHGDPALCWVADATFTTPLVGTLISDPSAELVSDDASLYVGHRGRDEFHFNCLQGQTWKYAGYPLLDHSLPATAICMVLPLKIVERQVAELKGLQ